MGIPGASDPGGLSGRRAQVGGGYGAGARGGGGGLQSVKTDASLRRGLAAKPAHGDPCLGWAQVGLGTRVVGRGNGRWLGGTLGRKPAPGWLGHSGYLGERVCVSACAAKGQRDSVTWQG